MSTDETWRPLRVVRAAAAGALTVACASAGAGLMEHSPLLPRVGEHGYVIEPSRRSSDASVKAYAAVNAEPGAGGTPCPVVPMREVVVADDTWLRLIAQVPEGDAQAFAAWMKRSANESGGRSNGEVLRHITNAIGAGLGMLADRQRRPPVRATLALRIVPANCEHLEVIQQDGYQARTHLRFPLAVQAPAMLGDYEYPGLFRWLTNVIGHEMAHSLQLMPFDNRRADWGRLGPRIATDRGQSHVGLRQELGAQLIEQCLLEAIVPSTPGDRMAAYLWTNHRRQFMELAKGEADGLQIYAAMFKLQEQVLGPKFVGSDPQLRLKDMWGLCARAARTPDRVLGKAAALTPGERNAGEKALAAVQAVGPPVVFEPAPAATGASPRQP